MSKRVQEQYDSVRSRTLLSVRARSQKSLEYQVRKKEMARPKGFEPLTLRFVV